MRFVGIDANDSVRVYALLTFIPFLLNNNKVHVLLGLFYNKIIRVVKPDLYQAVEFSSVVEVLVQYTRCNPYRFGGLGNT